MSACVLEEGRDEGGGAYGGVEAGGSGGTGEVQERTRREVLLSGRGRRACSEQGPHPSLHVKDHSTAHLWGANSGRRGWSRKRTSAPQMSNPHGSMPRVALVLRSRRSWPVAPQSYRRETLFNCGCIDMRLKAILTGLVQGHVVAIHTADPFTPTCSTATSHDVLLQTVRNHLRAAGFKCCRPAKKIALREHHMEERIRFAREYLDFD